MRLIDADALEDKAYWIQGDTGAVEVAEMNDVFAAAVRCVDCLTFDGCSVLEYVIDAVGDPRDFGCALFVRREP
jgi:hypothetical protein